MLRTHQSLATKYQKTMKMAGDRKTRKPESLKDGLLRTDFPNLRPSGFLIFRSSRPLPFWLTDFPFFRASTFDEFSSHGLRR